MEQALSITDILGGSRVLGRKIDEAEELVEAIRTGVPYKVFDAVREAAELSREEACTIFGIPPRTLARRKKEGRLTVEESDRIYRFAYLIARAQEVFGERQRTVRWLRKPNRALGNEAPISRLDTDLGTRQVEAILGRLEYGVFS